MSPSVSPTSSVPASPIPSGPAPPVVVTVQAPSADPKHPDYAKLFTGISQIFSTAAPVIINLVPDPKLALGLEIGAVGMGVTQQIFALLQQLHPPKAA